MSIPHSSPIAAIPDELLDRILFLTLTLSCRPHWHPYPQRTRTAPLAVCTRWRRVATPLLYADLRFESLPNFLSFIETPFVANPDLTKFVRRIVLPAAWPAATPLLAVCAPYLHELDLTLDAGVEPSGKSENHIYAHAFCEALEKAVQMRKLVLRKPLDVYLTHPKPGTLISGIARAMHAWDELESAEFPFRLADDSMHPNLHTEGPVHQLTRALATRPRLRTITTVTPNLWNEVLLRASVNPRLERISLSNVGQGLGIGPVDLGSSRMSSISAVLYDDNIHTPGSERNDLSRPFLGPGLFLREARRHSRLSALILAGMRGARLRACTLRLGGAGTARVHSEKIHQPIHAPYTVMLNTQAAESSTFFRAATGVVMTSTTVVSEHGNLGEIRTVEKPSERRKERKRRPASSYFPW